MKLKPKKNQKTFHLILAMALLILTTGSVVAQDCVDYSEYMQVAGHVELENTTRCVLVQDSVAYVSTSSGLCRIDISAPDSPRLMDYFSSRSFNDILLDDSLLYGISSNKLLVFDLSNPRDPHLISEFSIGYNCWQMVKKEDNLFLSRENGLIVLDVSDPAIPERVDVINIATDLFYLAIHEDTLYCTGNMNYIQLFDISDPNNPVTSGTYGTPAAATGLGSMADGLVVTFRKHGLKIYTHDPGSSPYLIGSLGLNQELNKFTISGDRCYIGAGGQGALIVDISDPSEPSLLGGASLAGFCYAPLMVDEILYAPCSLEGLFTVRALSSGSPEFLGSLTADGPVLSVARSGHYTFVVDGSPRLQVMDISELGSPVAVGSLDLPEDMYSVEAQGDILCARGEILGLYFVDISDPKNPSLLGEMTPWFAHLDVALSDDYAYVAYGSLKIISLDNLTDPEVVHEVILDGSGRAIALQDDLAYVATSDKGFSVVDISDPRDARVISGLNVGFWVTEIAVDGDQLYLSGWEKMAICDVSVPASPHLLTTIPTYFSYLSIEARDQIVYAASPPGGMTVYDMSDPLNPIIIGSQNRPCESWDILLEDGYLLMAGGLDGMIILGEQCSGLSSVQQPASSIPVAGFQLRGNHPNPFNPRTTISFRVETSQRLSVDVYDISGRRMNTLANRVFAVGDHQVDWQGRAGDGRELPSGTYFMRLKGARTEQTMKAILLK